MDYQTAYEMVRDGAGWCGMVRDAIIGNDAVVIPLVGEREGLIGAYIRTGEPPFVSGLTLHAEQMEALIEAWREMKATAANSEPEAEVPTDRLMLDDAWADNFGTS